MVNEYLADALINAGIMNDLVNLPADVKGAAAPGGKLKLLLVDHGIELFAWNSEGVYSVDCSKFTGRLCRHRRDC